MKAATFSKISIAVLIAGGGVYGLLGIFGVTSVRHESDLLKIDQVPLYVSKADSGDHGAASELYLYYKNSNQPEYALHWLRIAANGGGESPNEWLLDTLTNSESEKYHEEAALLLKRLADEGRAPFQVRFGEEVMRRNPDSADQKMAIGYFLSAAKQGYKPAIIEYSKISAGNIGSDQAGLDAMIWLGVAKLCLGRGQSDEVNAVEKSIEKSGIYSSLKSRWGEANEAANSIYYSIAKSNSNNKNLDFRYCGVEK